MPTLLTSPTTTGLEAPAGPWLLALDIDGTIMSEDGAISPGVIDQVRRLDAAGHHIVLATGRSAATALPVLERLGIAPRFLVCSNGSITLRRDPAAPNGYRREWVETFDPTEVLLVIRGHLSGASFAVEDEAGHYRYTDPFPDATIGLDSEHVAFEQLLHRLATRVVVVSPDHAMEDFLAVVEQMGLHRVSYAIGWSAWLDVSPEGVNKAMAAERVRRELAVPRSRVLAVGDGNNDIELLAWASDGGRGVAMGQAPEAVIAAAGEAAATVDDDGLAKVLATIGPPPAGSQPAV